MPAVSICPTAGAFYQAFTTGGLPLNAGYIWTYAAGGTTPTATYTTSAGNVQNANPIVLDASGRPPSEIWLVSGTAYRFDLYDSANNLIKTYDNLTGSASSTSGAFLPLAGGTMTGNIAMSGTQKLTGLAAGTVNGDSVRYEQSPAGILSAKGGLISATGANTPAYVAVGTNGQALVANSNNANGVNWASPAIRSYLAGCEMSTAGSSATMSIAAGLAVDDTNVSAMVLAAIAKTTSSWAVGTGNGGLDTGAIANNTWYHFFAIQRVDTGVVDVLLSLQPVSPTMPANYTLKRRIGSGRTNGSAQWTSFVQNGDVFTWATYILDINTTNPGTSAITQTLTVPTGVAVNALVNLGIDSTTSTAIACLLSPLSVTDQAPSATAAPLATLRTTTAAQWAVGSFQVMTNTSAQIRSRFSASGVADVLRIVTQGWIDRRGRDS